METYKIGDFLEHLKRSQVTKRFQGNFSDLLKDTKNYPGGAVSGFNLGIAQISPQKAENSLFNTRHSGRIIAKEGDIIMNVMASNSAYNWLTKFSKYDNIREYQFSHAYKIFNFHNDEIINQHYFVFLLKWNWFYQYIWTAHTGARDMNVNNFLNIKIKLPSLEKQQQLVDKLLPIYKVYHNICRILDKLDDYYRLIINLLFPAIDSPKQYLEKINAKYLFAASYLHKVSANYKIYSHSSYRRSNSCSIDLKNYSWSSDSFNLNPTLIKKPSIAKIYKFGNRLKILPHDLFICTISSKIQISIQPSQKLLNINSGDLNATYSQNKQVTSFFSLITKSPLSTTFSLRRSSSSDFTNRIFRNQLLRSPFYISEKLIEELIPTFTSCYQNSYTYFQKQKRIYFNYFKALLHKNFVTKEYCPIPKVSGGLSEKEG